MPVVFYQIGQQLDSWKHTHQFLALRELKKEIFGNMLTRSDLCRIGVTVGDNSLMDNDAEVPPTSVTSRVLFVDNRVNPSKRSRESNAGDEVADIVAEGEKRSTYTVMDRDLVGHSSRVKGNMTQREDMLVFSFRMADPDKWEFIMGRDLTPQPEEYLRFSCRR